MPQDPPRTSLEPLIPGSRDERYSDGDATPTGATDISAERRRARRGSLDSVDDMPRLQRGLGDLAPSAGDKAAVYLLAGGLLLFLPGTAALILLSSPTKLRYFAPHAPLNALGITCFVLGIAAVQPPTPPAGVRAARLAVHQRILLGIALPAMAVGTCFMYYNKSVNGADHITTWHATAGVVTILWMFVQAALGAASVWGGGALLGGGMRAKVVYKYHRISGYALIVLALFTAVLGGGYSTWATQRFPVLRFFAYGVGVPLILLGLLLRVRPDKMSIKLR